MSPTLGQEVAVGERWAYRARGVDPLIEVEVLKLGINRPARVRVRFLDEALEGREDWVPPTRLKCRWTHVDEFRADEGRWAAVCDERPCSTETEDDAAWAVYERVIDADTIALDYRASRRGTGRIPDVDRLAASLDLDRSLLTSSPLSFEYDGDLVVPWSIVKLVVKTAAARNAEPLLAQLDADERELREHLTYGTSHVSRRDGHEYQIEPEWYAEQDEKSSYGRAYRELIREWCGAVTVDKHDELAELRKEVARLAQLVGRAVTTLRHAGRPTEARQIERELGVTVDELRR